jgi:hypothetical protein
MGRRIVEGREMSQCNLLVGALEVPSQSRWMGGPAGCRSPVFEQRREMANVAASPRATYVCRRAALRRRKSCVGSRDAGGNDATLVVDVCVVGRGLVHHL